MLLLRVLHKDRRVSGAFYCSILEARAGLCQCYPGDMLFKRLEEMLEVPLGLEFFCNDDVGLRS